MTNSDPFNTGTIKTLRTTEEIWYEFKVMAATRGLALGAMLDELIRHNKAIPAGSVYVDQLMNAAHQINEYPADHLGTIIQQSDAWEDHMSWCKELEGSSE